MGWQATLREIGREQRRQEREALRRQKELQRQAKEQVKLSAIEQARLEVSTYENRLDLLLSVHKDQGPTWDWAGIAAAPNPPPPQRLSQHELRARQQACLHRQTQQPSPDDLITQARARDDQEYTTALDRHAAETANLEQLKPLARRILAGDPKAYTEALVELSPLSELSALGSAIHFTVHAPHLVECVLKVAGLQIIPIEVKTLTAAEKLSVKAMPRTRLHELYQDHICSCMLRVARETFALLPAETLLITASVDNTDPASGRRAEQPVLSAVFTRDRLAALDFERLDPSDAVDTFTHRGDFKASRKTAAFAPIFALTAADIISPAAQSADSADLLAQVRRLRADIRADLSALSPPAPAPAET